MTTIYVRTTGNDTTGTGATGAPYLTLNKALTAAVSGDTILLGDGTYMESTSGAGNLLINQVFTSRVTIAPESGRADRVVVQGSGATYGVVFGGGSNLHFDQITFEAQANTVTMVMRFNAASNVRFTRCVFRSQGGGYSVNGGAYSAAATVSAITFDACRFEQIGITPSGGINIENQGGAATLNDWRVLGCSFNTGLLGLRLMGVTNVRVSDNDVNSYAPSVGVNALQLGVDGPSGALTTGYVIGNRVRSVNGHAVVIGAGCEGVLVSSNTIHGGENAAAGQGLVVKEAIGVVIEYNTITSGYLSGVYFKAAVGCTFMHNVVFNEHVNSAALKIGYNSENNHACSGLVVRRNRFHASRGTVFSIGGNTDDSGGSYVDENVYSVSEGATFGIIRGSAVTKTTDLRSAWASYDRPVNDQNSRIGPKEAPFAGTPRISLPA